MARRARTQPGLNEAPNLLTLIERDRRASASSGGALFGPGSSLPTLSGPILAGPTLVDPLPDSPDLLDASPSNPTAPNQTPSGTEGHRARMRTRLLTAGPAALADHEMLEMVLFLALPRRDTKPLARLLLARFASFAGTIAATATELSTIDGLGEAGVAALKLVQAAALRLVRAELIDRPVLANWDRLIAYLTATLARERVEQFRVLFLDTRNRLLADEVQGRGTVNHTPVYPREVVKRALELNATALILVHNHPTRPILITFDHAPYH